MQLYQVILTPTPRLSMDNYKNFETITNNYSLPSGKYIKFIEF